MRIDVYMTEHGLSESRSKARAMIESGFVLINGKRVKKPAQEVCGGDTVTVTEQLKFVGRGGLKLLGALEAFSVDVTDAVCVDIGASTGGFTDCLLQHGAKRVYAVDSGTDQLHPSLKADSRVISMEKTNARALTAESLGERCDIAVMDVSFISQTLLFPAVKALLKDGGSLISLIKPQFEVTASQLGSNGILRDQRARLRGVRRVIDQACCHGLTALSLIQSPITGGDGNVEYLAHFVCGEIPEGKRELGADAKELEEICRGAHS
ncbi:MAG: TlyA family RNA methyltransferase [Clostridia bacterium]|nr:TlyA family RNA methyltransferase [Clostridia bacterium]